MKRLGVLVAVLAVAGCGSVPSSTSDARHHRPPTTTTVTPTTPPATTATTPTQPANGPQPTSCSYTAPTSSACEPVPAPGACHFRSEAGAQLPDRTCTPGALNPAVTPTTLKSTICVSGYTSKIRPPLSYTGPLKAKLMRAYGLNPANASQYELDHLVPLEGGGAAADPANLWPQPASPTPGFHQKDDEENFMRREVCGAKASQLRSVEAAMASDWVQLWQVDSPPHITFGAES